MSDAEAAAVEPEPVIRPPRWWLIPVIVAAAVILFVLIVVAVIAFVTKPSKFEAAIDECDMSKSEYARVGDGGRTLELDGSGAESGGLKLQDMVCVLVELDISDAVIGSMDSTRALDGRVTGTWDDINATWSYHPDNGLDVILTLK